MDYPGHGVQIALVTLELFIPHAQSLKEKRSAVRSLKETLKSRFNASVIEIDHQDKWQRAVLVACMLGGDRHRLEAETARLTKICEEAPRIHLVSMDQQWL